MTESDDDARHRAKMAKRKAGEVGVVQFIKGAWESGDKPGHDRLGVA